MSKIIDVAIDLMNEERGKMKRKALGYILIASVCLIWLGFETYTHGIVVAVITMVSTLVLTGMIMLGISLILGNPRQ